MDIKRTTHPGNKLRQVFRQHVGEPDGTTLLERLRALRRVRARRQVRNSARVEDVLSLDAVRAAPQQRLGPSHARLRRVRRELAGKRERGWEHVLAIRERRVVKALQERRVGRVRPSAEQHRHRARIAEETREEVGRDPCVAITVIGTVSQSVILEYSSIGGPATLCPPPPLTACAKQKGRERERERERERW